MTDLVKRLRHVWELFEGGSPRDVAEAIPLQTLVGEAAGEIERLSAKTRYPRGVVDVKTLPNLRVRLSRSVTTDARGVTIRGYYFIDWNRIKTGEQLAGWLWHLAKKSWWNSQFTVALIKEVHLKFPAAVRRDT